MPAHTKVQSSRPGGLGRKIYSASLQFCIANDQALLAKYEFNNNAKLEEFMDDLPQDKKQQFHALVEERHLVPKVGLQVAVDVAGISSYSLTMGIIMR